MQTHQMKFGYEMCEYFEKYSQYIRRCAGTVKNNQRRRKETVYIRHF